MTAETMTDIRYYYDSHPTEEDLMPESDLHASLARYLEQVLQWLFREENWFLSKNLAIYRTTNEHEKPVAPDVALFKGVVYTEELRLSLRSWSIPRRGGIAPSVAFEIASEETWAQDLREKPAIYAAMRVPESFFYDPRPGRRRGQPRLLAWASENGEPREIPADPDGRIWSEELASFLIPDGDTLRLTDLHGEPRLTALEAEQQARLAAQQARLAERQARRLAEQERDRLRARLLAAGIDPDGP